MKAPKNLRFLVLVPFLAIYFHSCELFQEDMFPVYLGQEQAQIDMTKVRQAAGLSSSTFIGQIYPIKIPTLQKSYIVLSLHQFMGPSALVILDGKTLDIRKIFTEIPVGKFFVLDMEGYMVTGNGQTLSRIDPASLVETVITISTDPIDFAQFGFSADVSGTNTTLLVGMESGGITVKGYSNTTNPWDFVNPDKSQPYILATSPAASDAGNFLLQDLYYDGSTIRLALRNNLTNEAYIFFWNSVSSFIASFSATHLASGANFVKVPNSTNDSGELNRGGYIIRTDNKGPALERYRFDADNALLDRFRLPPNSRGRVAFYKDGSGWLLYDEGADTLHLLRPWWQE